MPDTLGNLPNAASALLAPLGVVCVSAVGWLIHQNRKLQQSRHLYLSQTKHLSNVIWATNAGTWDWNVVTGEITVNERWAQIIGYTLAEVTPMNLHNWSERHHPEDRIRSNDQVQRCLARETDHYRCELRIRNKSGDWVWVLNQGRVVEWDDQQRPLRMSGAQTDITERKLTTQRDHHRSRILQMLATDSTLDSVLDTIARDITDVDPHMLCSIRLVDPDGMTPFYTAAPYLPAFFVSTMDAFESHANLRSGEINNVSASIAEDIATHPHWADMADMAQRAGLASCWSQPIVSVQGKVLGTFSIFDRTPRAPTPDNLQLLKDEARLTALAIEKSSASMRQQLAASVFSHAREGIAITDANANIIDVNETFCIITGYRRDEIIGKNSRTLRSNLHTPEFFADMWESLLERGHWSGEIWNQRKSGQIYPQMTTISAVRDQGGVINNFVSLFTDITSIKDHQRQLEHIAHYDALTGLPNRVLLADRLNQGIYQSQRHKRSLAVAYLDLDGFKAVNDTHGHNMGDELLIVVSRRMKAVMREADTLARIGGDEFIAVLVDLDVHGDSQVVLTRLLEAASAPVTVGTLQLQVSASIGVTVYPEDASDADVLMRHADQAMYAAKQAGKNRYHYFDVAQDAAVQTQQESLNQFRMALDAKQFVLYYQPKVDMRGGTVIGAEALIRWQHPERGLLAPAAFLDAVETHSMGIEMGEWVIETALLQMQIWQEQGLDLPISVNISAHQLQSRDFIEKLGAALARHPGVAPGKLELEILETSALQDIGAVSLIMQTCAKLGVHFALDDFGTGYSSLTYLKHGVSSFSVQ